MKSMWLSGITALLTAAGGWSQVPVPPAPVRPIVRPTGGGTDGGVTINPPARPTKRFVTHVVLAEERVWHSRDGRPLRGKLIAFEDAVAEVKDGAADPPTPQPPASPTVMRDDKVRLLVDKKAFVLPLARLAQEDQDFIKSLRDRLAKAAAARRQGG